MDKILTVASKGRVWILLRFEVKILRSKIPFFDPHFL